VITAELQRVVFLTIEIQRFFSTEIQRQQREAKRGLDK